MSPSPPTGQDPIPNPGSAPRGRRLGARTATLALWAALALFPSLGCSSAPLLCDDPEEANIERAVSRDESSIGALFGVISGFFTRAPDH